MLPCRSFPAGCLQVTDIDPETLHLRMPEESKQAILALAATVSSCYQRDKAAAAALQTHLVAQTLKHLGHEMHDVRLGNRAHSLCDGSESLQSGGRKQTIVQGCRKVNSCSTTKVLCCSLHTPIYWLFLLL